MTIQSVFDPSFSKYGQVLTGYDLTGLLDTSSRETFTLLFADMDNLKSINDQWGHLAGDQALLQLAQTFRHLFPEMVLSARWGGDEFLLLLPGALEEDTLRARLTPLLNSDTSQLSCSPGAAILAPGTGVEQAIHQADMALYQAKQHKPALYISRNQTT